MMKIASQLFFLLPLAMGIGIAMTFQTAINTQLREYLHSPLQAALLSFLIGTIVLAVLVIIQTTLQAVSKPSLHELNMIPWYLWLGGCLGVYAISISIYTAPKLGFSTLSGLIIFGQILMSMLIDHFGLLGSEKTPINWQRFLGGVVIFIGVLLTLQR